MGMFDRIEVPEESSKCPYCEHLLTDWQSKDGPCTSSLLQYYEVDNFYTSCVNCQAWIEYNYTKPEHRTMCDYTFTWRDLTDER